MNTIIHFYNINTDHTLRVIMSTVHGSGGEVIHYTKGKDLTIKIKKSIRLASLKHMIEAFGSDGEISITNGKDFTEETMFNENLRNYIYETNSIFNPSI